MSVFTFIFRPLFYLISVDWHHDVVMIAHYGVGTKIDKKYRTWQLNATDNPLATVFEVKANEALDPHRKVRRTHREMHWQYGVSSIETWRYLDSGMYPD